MPRGKKTIASLNASVATSGIMMSSASKWRRKAGTHRVERPEPVKLLGRGAQHEEGSPIVRRVAHPNTRDA